MLSFLLRKMINNKWMIISLLIGNILLVGTVSSVPLYRNATLQRMLLKELQEYQRNNNAYPGLLEIRYSFTGDNEQSIEYFKFMRDAKNEEIAQAFDIPLLDIVELINISGISIYPEIKREETPKTRGVQLSGYSNFENHIKIIQGSMFSEGINDGIIEAVVSYKTLIDMDLLLGEILTDEKYIINGKPLRIKITGIFENSEENDPYWTISPNYLGTSIVISHDLANDIVLTNRPAKLRVESTWWHLYDYSSMTVLKTEQYANADSIYREIFNKMGSPLRYKNNFTPIISTYQTKASSLSITLWVLQVPIFVMLAFFIFMVSRQILVIEQNEISVIKSRGASRGQIISIYFWQSLIICLLGVPLGIPVGVYICRLLGSSNGFLNLVQRSALSITLVSDVFFYTAIAAFFSLLTMTMPVFGYSKVTIVDYKRSKFAKRNKPLWRRFFLDIVALVISISSLYAFNRTSGLYIDYVSSANTIDPLLFLCSSLFIIGLGLVLLRIYPLIIKLIYTLFKNFWSPAFYASFIKLIRSGGEEQFIMIFLVFTLAAGVFDAKAARSLNLNSEDKTKYEIGADLVFKEVWSDNSDSDPETTINARDIIYTEPDFEKFIHFDEVTSITKVLQESVTVTLLAGYLQNVSLMGINSKEFGETAWFRDDLLPVHINEYLNALAIEPSSVLLSTNFRDTYGYEVNDIITFRTKDGTIIRSPIYGFVDYWPGFSNVTRSRIQDGRIIEKENWLIISNLQYTQSVYGLTPYEIWMKTESDNNNFIYTYADNNGIKFSLFRDSKANIIKTRNDPMLQGINGVLTVGFITIIIICAAGFLIYWILAIKSRALQFGIFRAMGMSFKNILGMLVIEQVLITGSSIALGILTGEISSRLFVPLLQLAYTASEKVIPFKIVTEQADYIRLISITGIMIVSCVIILSTIISKIKITQALKLGED